MAATCSSTRRRRSPARGRRTLPKPSKGKGALGAIPTAESESPAPPTEGVRWCGQAPPEDVRDGSPRSACRSDRPAASIVATAAQPGQHEDRTLILADVAHKALVQTEHFTRELLKRHMPHDRARDVARLLASGRWTHDHPLQARDIEALGLPVRVGVPSEERDLMLLYPQPRGREPAVEYVPGSPARPRLPGWHLALRARVVMADHVGWRRSVSLELV